MKRRFSNQTHDLPNAIQNVCRSECLHGQEDEVTARLSKLQSEIGLDNTIIPGYSPTLAANIENLENMHKIYDMTDNIFDPICYAAAKSKSNPDSLSMGEMKQSEDRP